jgi:hypothetical protein
VPSRAIARAEAAAEMETILPEASEKIPPAAGAREGAPPSVAAAAAAPSSSCRPSPPPNSPAPSSPNRALALAAAVAETATGPPFPEASEKIPAGPAGTGEGAEAGRSVGFRAAVAAPVPCCCCCLCCCHCCSCCSC